MPIPDTLAEKLDMFRSCGRLLKRDYDLFQDGSWLAVMLGQGIRPTGYDPLTESIRPVELDRVLQGMRGAIAKAAHDMPTHASFIKRHCRAEGIAPSTTAGDALAATRG